MTYKLENIPDHLDRALRERAVAQQKSPEAVIIDLVADGLNAKLADANGDKATVDDACDVVKDRELEMALREQRLIDWEVWSDDVKRRDLSGIAGLHLITPEMKAVFAEQRRIDPELWK
jgi:plasmid stability protein